MHLQAPNWLQHLLLVVLLLVPRQEGKAMWSAQQQAGGGVVHVAELQVQQGSRNRVPASCLFTQQLYLAAEGPGLCIYCPRTF